MREHSSAIERKEGPQLRRHCCEEAFHSALIPTPKKPIFPLKSRRIAASSRRSWSVPSDQRR